MEERYVGRFIFIVHEVEWLFVGDFVLSEKLWSTK